MNPLQKTICCLLMVFLFQGALACGSKKAETWSIPLKDYPVRISGRQFVWEVTYAGPDGQLDTRDDFKVENELVIPIHSKLKLEMLSQDVLHGLFIPHLGLKQLLFPGQVARESFDLRHEAKFRMACSEICGVGHGKMVGWVKVVSKSEYEQWLKTNFVQPELVDHKKTVVPSQ